MTTLSASRTRAYTNTNINGLLVPAATTIYAGAAVGVNEATGNPRPLQAGDKFIGFAQSSVNHIRGQEREAPLTVVDSGQVALQISGAVATDIGKDVFATDDDTFTFSSSGGSLVGVAKQLLSAGRMLVEILPPSALNGVRLAPGGTALVSGDGTVTPISATFAAAVPLTGLPTDMGSYVVTGALAFTAAAGATVGGSATVDLVADGVNTPTFSGMFPTNGSADYLNFAGAINTITFYKSSDVVWYSITNNASVVSGTYEVAVTETALEYMTNSGGGIYTATASGTSNGAKMVIDRQLPANADGYTVCTYDTGGDVACTLAFDAASNNVALLEGNNDFSVRVSLAGLLSVGTNGAPTTTGITITAASTTRLRLRRASGVVTAEYSYDSGATWTVAYTWAGSSTALLYAHFYTTYSTTGKRLVSPKTAGLVPA